MKKLLPIIAVLAILAICTGCQFPNLNKVIPALAKDPASAHIRVTTIYGTIEYTRTNPLTNSLSHSIAPDGTITVERNTNPPLPPEPLRGASRSPQ